MFVLRTLILALVAAISLGTVSFAQVEDYRDITYPELGELNIPQPESFELSNGMKIYLVEDHELPLIGIRGVVRTGNLLDPATKTGLGSVLGTVLRTGGTSHRTGDEIDEFLESRAASVEVGISEASGSFSLGALKEDFAEVLPILVDVLRNPVFDEEKIDLAKVQLKTGIARRNDSLGGIANREFQQLIFGADSDVGRIPEYDTVAAITREDLVAWHQRDFHPNNILLGVVGDFDTASMKKTLEQAFGSWPRGPETGHMSPAYRQEPNPGIFFVEKEDVTQASVFMGHQGIFYSNPDYYTVQVMNAILGGGFSGRLMKKIRTEMGLVYGVGGGVKSGFSYPGLTSSNLQTKSESTVEAIRAVQEELERMKAEPPTQKEVDNAREIILNSFVFRFTSPGQILNRQMIYEYYGLPSDFLDRYQEQVRAVTPEDIFAVAKKYFHLEDMTLLVVGHAEDFGTPLSELGEVQTLDISIPPPSTVKVEVDRGEEAALKGGAVLAQMASILGGENAADVIALRSKGTTTIKIQGQSIQITQDRLTVFPDRSRQVIQTPMGQQTVVLVGEAGWVLSPAGTQDLPAEKVAENQKDTGHDLRYLVRYAHSESKAWFQGEEEVDGVPCRVLVVDLYGTESRLWVAVDGTVLQHSYQGSHPFTGVPGEMVLSYEDYRELEGIMVPHRVVTTFSGEEFATTDLLSFEVDPEVDESLFTKP